MLRYPTSDDIFYDGYAEALRSVERFIASGGYRFSPSAMADLVRSPRPRYSFRTDREHESLNERRRAFFEELIGAYGCGHQQVSFNAAIPGFGPEQAIDIVIYEDQDRRRPLCAIDFSREHDVRPRREAVADIVEKGRRLGARYAAYVARDERLYIDIELWSEAAPEQGYLKGLPL